jgi:hypothetical protein
LNAQAFPQIAGANAHRFEGLKQTQGHRKTVDQFFKLFDVVGASQALCQRL